MGIIYKAPNFSQRRANPDFDRLTRNFAKKIKFLDKDGQNTGKNLC